MKDLTSPKDVKKMMTSSKPVAIFFYMDGCPHCEAMKGPWLDIENENPNVDFAEVESANVPPELGIYAFPKFIKVKDGKKTTVEGEMTGGELKQKLFGVRGGRRTRGRLIRRIRKRHSRTTRRNIPS
jgi:thiol-disulfide isomerase/thioredoxin